MFFSLSTFLSAFLSTTNTTQGTSEPYSLAQELLGHADFEVVGDLPDDVGPIYSHDEGPGKVKMFRDTGISRRPYYVRGY